MSSPDDCERLPNLHQLSKELKRPVSTLVVLSPQRDPFHLGMPSRLRGAEWFADLWRRYGRKGLHPHGLHYVLVSQPKGAISLPDGAPYENTREHDTRLAGAARDARYLGFVLADDMVDRRNAEADLNHSYESRPANGGIAEYRHKVEFRVPNVAIDEFPLWPQLMVWKPIIPQRYLVEIWIEKSTMGGIIGPIAFQFGVNVVSGMGQTSEVRCRERVERARLAGKPVIILYVSDFDPSGESMPVAAARKMEFWIRKTAPDIDLKLIPIMLTADQCRHYRLPRTPLKDTELRKEGGEKRYGEGATELDALEALHPGEFGRILTEEVERYYDRTLQRRINKVEAEVDEALDEINNKVYAEHSDEIQALRTEYHVLTDQVRARLEEIESEFREKFQDLSARTKSYWQEVEDSLDGQFDFDSVEWPEPEEGDEDDDPLFDSSRDYISQCDRFKRHQDKPTRRKSGSRWNSPTRGVGVPDPAE